MTRDEVIHHLARLKFFLADQGYTALAGVYEDAEVKLHCDKLSPAQCRIYADMLLPPGRRGRITLVLLRPVEARALVLLRWLLRSVTMPPSIAPPLSAEAKRARMPPPVDYFLGARQDSVHIDAPVVVRVAKSGRVRRDAS